MNEVTILTTTAVTILTVLSMSASRIRQRQLSIPVENSPTVAVQNSPLNRFLSRKIQFSVAPDGAEPSADLGRRVLGGAETGATEKRAASFPSRSEAGSSPAG